MIWRFGWVRICQMPGSRLRMRAAPSNSWSIAAKIEPVLVPMSLIVKLASVTWPVQPSQLRAAIMPLYEDARPKRQGAVAAGNARAGIEEVARACERLHDDLGAPDRAPVHAGRRRRPRAPGSGAVPIHARHPSHRLPSYSFGPAL